MVVSAHPVQIAPGVETVATGGDHLHAFRAVLDAIAKSRHVCSHVYLDAELPFLNELYAPGITIFREEPNYSLKGQEVQSEPHEEIIEKLNEAGKHFQVLLLKTNLTLPYMSVFMQLECGY